MGYINIMLNLQRIFSDFSNLSELLAKKGVSRRRLLFIKKQLGKKKELVGGINKLQQDRNKLSLEGLKNAEIVREIRIRIRQQETELEKLEMKLVKLTSELPNLPAIDTPDNHEGNRLINSVSYQYDILHGLTHETIIKRLELVD
jgi:seryl-tRNA synthetase